MTNPATLRLLRIQLFPALILLFFPWLLQGQTFYSHGGNIPNNSTGTCFSQNVSGVGNLSATNGLMRVCLSISQARPADMDIYLQSPTGTVIMLSTDNGGTSGNDYYEGLCFSDCAPNGSITLGSDFRGVYTPEAALSGFNTGVSGNGTWQLCIDDDNALGTNSTLNYWSLTFGTSVPHNSPTGETCATAYPLTSLPYSSTCMSLAGHVDDYSACNSNMDGAEYLYSITPTASGQYLSVDIAQDFNAPSGFPTVLLLDVCPSVAMPANCIQTEIQMFSYENILHITSQPLTVGTTYYIVVASTSGVGGAFDMRINLGQNGNDNCLQATQITEGYEYAGNNYAAAIPNTQAPGTAEMTCNGSIDNFIYYTFTTDMAGSSVYIHVTDIDCDLSCGGACGIQLALFQRPAGGPCLGPGSWGAPVFCEASTTTNQYYQWTGLLPNTQYYLMVDGNAGSPCVWNLRASGDLGALLPVTLTQVSAQEEGPSNLVKWQTSKEVNLSHYEIEHGLSPESLSKVGTVSPKGTDGQAHEYSFLHPGFENGAHYYRIRSVDMNGSSQYSEIVRVDRKENEVGVSVYPNPARSEVKVSFLVKGESKLNVTDLNGRILQSHTFSAESELMHVSLDISGLSNGIYLVQVMGENGSAVKRFTKCD